MSRDSERTLVVRNNLYLSRGDEHPSYVNLPTGASFAWEKNTWRVARVHRPVTVAAHTDLSHRHEPFAAQRRQHHQAARLSARPCFPTRMTRTSASKGANTIHMKLYARSVGTSFDEQRSCFAMSRFHGEVQWSVPFFSIAC